MQIHRELLWFSFSNNFSRSDLIHLHGRFPILLLVSIEDTQILFFFFYLLRGAALRYSGSAFESVWPFAMYNITPATTTSTTTTMF